MEVIDCTFCRRGSILLNGLDPQKMDKSYTMYFDESGNTRCFWIKDGNYNVDPFTHFVLGGIVANNPVSFEYAKNRIECNSTVQEIKTKNVCKGSFEECLRDKKLENYFDLLIEQNWFVHFSVVELFYYGIVDIVDSIVNNDNDVSDLKNELNRILRYDVQKSLKMMIESEYPNIKDENIKSFLTDCINIIDNYIINTGKANNLTYKLRVLFQLAENKDELTFIQDEVTGTMIKDFAHFYQRPIYMFCNSHIVFDEETYIQESVKSYKLTLDGKELDNYQFIDSKSEVMVQLSDVFVGILARYLRFINTNINIVDSIVEQFDEQQLASLIKLNYILRISEAENSAFWDMFTSSDMRTAFSMLVEKSYSITDGSFDIQTHT
jgi:hypothetical protein